MAERINIPSIINREKGFLESEAALQQKAWEDHEAYKRIARNNDYEGLAALAEGLNPGGNMHFQDKYKLWNHRTFSPNSRNWLVGLAALNQQGKLSDEYFNLLLKNPDFQSWTQDENGKYTYHALPYQMRDSSWWDYMNRNEKDVDVVPAIQSLLQK